MCGLIAAWSPHGFDKPCFEQALADMYHRGPDASGSINRDQNRIHMAHRRLKIIDTTDSSNQPFISPCGRWALVYNGEIYNYRELKAEIRDRWEWRTNSDTEVLLAAWSLWGAGCLQKLVGMFAFVLHDATTNKLTVVRDRFGVKPAYYTQEDGKWFFASEIPPLLRFKKKIRENKSTIRTYLELGLYDHSDNTFFEGVKSLQPGSLLELDLASGKETTSKWYELSKHIPDYGGASREELTNLCKFMILQAVSSHLVADVAVGLNVSGGADSAMLIRASLKELGHAHLFSQDYQGYSELPWISEIAEGGTLHVSKLDLEQISDYLDRTVAYQAEPFGGVFVCGYNALYEAAHRENVTVLLDGNGVDEAFLGYKKYHQIYVSSGRNYAERQERSGIFAELWGHAPRFVVKGASIDGTNGLRPEVMAPGLHNVELLKIPELHDFTDPVRRAAAEDLYFSKIPRGLRFNDRLSMSHSRELRVPYLDHRLVEFAFGLPIDLLINERGGKAIFRDVLASYVPDSVAYAKKRSIQSPQREWLGNGWRPLVEDILGSESFAARGWIDPVIAKKTYADYLKGNQENSFFVWQWVNLELWAQSQLD